MLEILKIAHGNDIKYDYLYSSECRFSIEEYGLSFISTYCAIENSETKKSTCKLIGERTNRNMLDFIENGGFLNKVIGKTVYLF